MNTLLVCMQNESDAMAKLVDVLKSEQTALTQAPSMALMDEINAITKQKNQLITDISQIGQLRNIELNKLGFNGGDISMPSWLQDQEQKDCWANLIKHTKKAKELNRVNGLLISKHLTRNRTTLQVLYKHHRPNAMPSLYGANGQSSTQRSVIRGVVV
jgi:flagellar biosynthesis protein FlgN